MKRVDEMIGSLNSEKAEQQLKHLYGSDERMLKNQKERYETLIRRYADQFGDRQGIRLVSAPGRTEIGGNHTDHNHGRVLAAAVNLDALCAVSPRDDLTVRFYSEGYDPIEMDLSDLNVQPGEEGTTRALIRGVAAGMKKNGYRIGGCRNFDGCGRERTEQLGRAGSYADRCAGLPVQPLRYAVCSSGSDQ